MNRMLQSKVLRCVLTTALILGVVLSVPTPVSARVIARDSWTAQLEPRKQQEVVSTPLLVEGGQDILLAMQEETRRITIPIEAAEDVSWDLTVVSSQPDYLRVRLATTEEQEFLDQTILSGYDEDHAYGSGTCSMDIWLEIVKTEADTTPENDGIVTGEEQPTDSGLQTTEDPMAPLTTEGETPESNTDDGTTTEEENVAPEVAYIEVTLTYYTYGLPEEEPSEELPIVEETETGAAEPPATEVIVTEETAPEITDPEVTDTENTETEPTDPTEPAPLSATFQVPLKEQKIDPAIYSGTLSKVPTTYNPLIDIPLLNGDLPSVLTLHGADFPAMTAYTIGDARRCVLYDGGTILLPEQAMVLLDISETELNPLHQTEEPEEETPDTEQTGEVSPSAPEGPATTEEIPAVQPSAGETTNEISSTTEETTTDGPVVTEPETAPEQETAPHSITLQAGEATYTMKYVPSSIWGPGGSPFIIGGEESIVLDGTLRMAQPEAVTETEQTAEVSRTGELEPVLQVQQLTWSRDGLAWEKAPYWMLGEAESGLTLEKDPAQPLPQAGTYRLTIDWVRENMTLYSLQTVFYVRYADVG